MRFFKRLFKRKKKTEAIEPVLIDSYKVFNTFDDSREIVKQEQEISCVLTFLNGKNLDDFIIEHWYFEDNLPFCESYIGSDFFAINKDKIPEKKVTKTFPINYSRRMKSRETKSDPHFMTGLPQVDKHYQKDFSKQVIDGYRSSAYKTSCISPDFQTLSIEITNSDYKNPHIARLFAANIDPDDHHLPNDITISVSESSHLALKDKIRNNVLQIQGIKYSADSVAQIRHVFTIGEYFENKQNSYRWQPMNYRSPLNQIVPRIEHPNFELTVYPFTFLDIKILPGESVFIEFNIKNTFPIDNDNNKDESFETEVNEINEYEDSDYPKMDLLYKNLYVSSPNHYGNFIIEPDSDYPKMDLLSNPFRNISPIHILEEYPDSFYEDGVDY